MLLLMTTLKDVAIKTTDFHFVSEFLTYLGIRNNQLSVDRPINTTCTVKFVADREQYNHIAELCKENGKILSLSSKNHKNARREYSPSGDAALNQE